MVVAAAGVVVVRVVVVVVVVVLVVVLLVVVVVGVVVHRSRSWTGSSGSSRRRRRRAGSGGRKQELEEMDKQHAQAEGPFSSVLQEIFVQNHKLLHLLSQISSELCATISQKQDGIRLTTTPSFSDLLHALNSKP